MSDGSCIRPARRGTGSLSRDRRALSSADSARALRPALCSLRNRGRRSGHALGHARVRRPQFESEKPSRDAGFRAKTRTEDTTSSRQEKARAPSQCPAECGRTVRVTGSTPTEVLERLQIPQPWRGTVGAGRGSHRPRHRRRPLLRFVRLSSERTLEPVRRHSCIAEKQQSPLRSWSSSDAAADSCPSRRSLWRGSQLVQLSSERRVKASGALCLVDEGGDRARGWPR